MVTLKKWNRRKFRLEVRDDNSGSLIYHPIYLDVTELGELAEQLSDVIEEIESIKRELREEDFDG